MKTVGLIGGMSWESTAVYYRLINEEVKRRLGGLHSAELLVWSFDFDEIAALQAAGDWDGATARMIDAGERLKRAGAEALAICTNTMHKMAPEVENRCGLPLLHIADATARAVRKGGFSSVGLLATRFTMEQDFYTGRLRDLHGIEALTPDEPDRGIVHDVIYDELCRGAVNADSKRRYLEIIDALARRGAQAVILGCTEIGMLVGQQDVTLPLFDTTTLHAEAIADYALG